MYDLKSQISSGKWRTRLWISSKRSWTSYSLLTDLVSDKTIKGFLRSAIIEVKKSVISWAWGNINVFCFSDAELETQFPCFVCLMTQVWWWKVNQLRIELLSVRGHSILLDMTEVIVTHCSALFVSLWLEMSSSRLCLFWLWRSVCPGDCFPWCYGECAGHQSTCLSGPARPSTPPASSQ